MEIKELVSKSKEIVTQPKDHEGIFYDAFSYTIQNPSKGPSNKNYLYIVSQIQSDDKSLDYLPNLIASFIKRELETGLPAPARAGGQAGNGYLNDEEKLFENSLKKTNELIDGILKSSGPIKLDLGVAFVDKEKITVSKIGKAKMLIYRPPAEREYSGRSASPEKEETFDIFENVTQFNKLPIDNERFFSITSGEVKKGDRFFFFIPNIRLNPKQKLIVSTLCKREENFLNSIHKIISPVPCCGIYFEMKEETKKVIRESVKETASVISNKDKGAPVMATEVAKINKGDTIKRTTDKFKEMIMGNSSVSTINKGANNKNWRLIRPRGMNNYFIVTVIAAIVISGLFFLTRGNSKLKEELASINEKLRISESRFLLKQNYEARKFLSEAFKELKLLEESKQKNEALLSAIGLLNQIEKITPEVKPVVLLDLTTYQNLDPNKLKSILIQDGKVFTNDSEKVYSIEEETKPIEESGSIILSWIKNNKIILLDNTIKVIDLEENKINELKKKFSFEPIEMKNYEDNLYFLGSKNIYKISNALASPLEELEWLKAIEAEKINGNFISFDLDSNIYVLTDERKLVTLFKGELKNLIDLDFDVRPGLELTALEKNEFLVADKENKIVRVIDDLGGLKVSYNLSEVDAVKDTFFDKQNKTLYILSPTKIWSLKI